MKKIRNWFYKFMYRRNGVDSLGRAMLIPTLIFFLIAIPLDGLARIVVTSAGWACIIYMYFRMFSKNIYQRKKENTWFEGKTYYLRTRFKQSKDYRFYDCPKCKTHLRVPKGVGTVTITCKTCGYKFDRKA